MIDGQTPNRVRHLNQSTCKPPGSRQAPSGFYGSSSRVFGWTVLRMPLAMPGPATPLGVLAGRSGGTPDTHSCHDLSFSFLGFLLASCHHGMRVRRARVARTWLGRRERKGMSWLTLSAPVRFLETYRETARARQQEWLPLVLASLPCRRLLLCPARLHTNFHPGVASTSLRDRAPCLSHPHRPLSVAPGEAERLEC